jgi:hypothetical protein
LAGLFQAVLSEKDKPFVSSNAMTAMTRSPAMGTCVHFSRSLPSNSWWQSGDFQAADSNPKCNTATSRIRIVLDRRHEGGASHLANGVLWTD